MGSKSDAALRRVGVATLLLVACRGGLPPEPPGADAADPDAEVSAYDPGPDPTQRSAFEGVETDERGGHGHHHHGHGDPETTKPGHEHQDNREGGG